MTKKIEYSNYPKYPIEAFALAAVLFSSGMKEAMIVGIGLIFGDILQGVLQDFANQKYAQTLSAVGAAVTCGVIYLMATLVGITPDVRQIIGFAVLGLLLIKHQETGREKSNLALNLNTNNGQAKQQQDMVERQNVIDYNDILLSDSIAYGMFVLFAIIREYLAGATIFGCKLPELAFCSGTYGKPMLVLVGAGLIIALINRILHVTSDMNAAVWVCIPVILLQVPFVWNNVPEWLGMIVGIVTVGVVYITLRKKLLFSDTEKHIEGIPVELVMLGVVYMVFGLL